MTKTISPLRDPELMRMLADEPELLAIADALVETERERGGTRPLLRRPRRLRSVAAAAAVVAAAVAVLLVSPWSGSGGGLVQRALAAVGTGPVLHVVTERQIPPSLYDAVSLPSGTPIQVTERVEIWFDQTRELKKTIATSNGVLIYQYLGTPQGSFIPEGNPLKLCILNASHQGFSCVNTNTQGTGPNMPGPPPTLEVALAGFVDHYQSALASGEATKAGTGQIGGHQVIWLRINAERKDYIPAEDVAIDASTYAPVLVRTLDTNPVQFTVTEIDTQAYDPALFTPPAREYPPVSSTAEAPTTIDATQVPGILGGKALWLGQAWNGYRLVKVEKQSLVDDYAPQSGKQPIQSVGVIFTYAPPSGSTDSPDVLQIEEAAQCEAAWQMLCDPRPPPTEGILRLGQGPIPSTMMRDGIYVAIAQKSSKTDPVAVANALQPVPAETK